MFDLKESDLRVTTKPVQKSRRTIDNKIRDKIMQHFSHSTETLVIPISGYQDLIPLMIGPNYRSIIQELEPFQFDVLRGPPMHLVIELQKWIDPIFEDKKSLEQLKANDLQLFHLVKIPSVIYNSGIQGLLYDLGDNKLLKLGKAAEKSRVPVGWSSQAALRQALVLARGYKKCKYVPRPYGIAWVPSLQGWGLIMQKIPDVQTFREYLEKVPDSQAQKSRLLGLIRDSLRTGTCLHDQKITFDFGGMNNIVLGRNDTGDVIPYFVDLDERQKDRSAASEHIRQAIRTYILKDLIGEKVAKKLSI